MSETSPEGTPKSEPEELASWLVPDRSEFDRITNSRLKMEIRILGRHGEKPITTPDRLEDVYERIVDLTRNGEITDSDAIPWLDRITKRQEELVSQKGQGTKRKGEDELLELQRESVELQKQQLGYEEQQVGLLRKGYNGFIQAEKVRARVNPEQFDQLLPPWFEELPDDEKSVIRTRLHINYLAALKRDAGMVSLDTWAEALGLRIERSALVSEWEEMPGFRVVMATMISDVFDKNQDHLVISGELEDKDKNKEATGGYAIIGKPTKFEEYKGRLAGAVVEYLEPQRKKLEEKYKVKLEELARAAVTAVDNFFFAAGAYDSGDEKRAITPGSANIYSEQARAFFMPGIKGREGKWLIKRGKKAKGVTEETFGGPLGEWIRENAQANRGGFGDKLRKEKEWYRLIPNRFFYSLVDLTEFVEEEGFDWSEKSLAQALLHEPTQSLSIGGLVDYENSGKGIDMKLIKPDDLLGSYADERSDAIKLYKHITSDDPKERLERSKFLHVLTRVRGKGGLLNKIFTDEEVVIAGLIMMVSPEKGLIKGTTKMVLDIPGPLYDSSVTQALSDNRIYEGMEPGFRKRIFQKLHAVDTMTAAGSLSSLLGLTESMLSARERIKMEASGNVRKEFKKY